MPDRQHIFKRRALATQLAACGLLWATFLPTVNGQEKGGALPVLPEVTIESRTSQGSMRHGALRDEIVATESISARTIERSGATNLTEAVDKNPGVAVQVECSICNVRNVLLNNLPGRYTTLLIDGIPIYSSVSSAYGLDSVGTYGLERIDIARGAGASLIAPEALAGTVDLVTKRPTAPEAKLRVQGGRFQSRQAEAYLAKPLQGGALALSMHYNKHDPVDGSGDGVSEYSGYDRRMAGLGFFVDDLGGFRVRGRVDAVDEKRGGGPMDNLSNPSGVYASRSGNPFDFRIGPNGSSYKDGWDAPDGSGSHIWDDGKLGMAEYIHTKRQQFVVSGERAVGEGRLRLALGAAYHKQDSFYEGVDYDADQDQYYFEASYQLPVAQWLVTTGLNYRYENLESHSALMDGTDTSGLDNYVYRTPGLFVQAYRSLFDDKLELNASLRWDKNNVFGNIISPRMNMLFHHNDHYSSRLSFGKGFRAPTSFFEQDHGILDTTRIQREIDKPEVSYNLNYALNYTSERLAITGSYNYNRIKNFALLDPGHEDGAGNPVTLFTASSGKVEVQGVDINASYLLTPALTVSVGAEAFDYRFPAGTLTFARPDWRAFFSLDYERGPWMGMARVNVTGTMDLNKFHDDGSGSQNRFNFDGSPKRTKSPTFATLDARLEYAVHRNLSLFVGADNLLDYRQSKKENFLWINPEGDFDVTHIWGPSRGRYVYAGAKLSF